jgi:hypothetical protein
VIDYRKRSAEGTLQRRVFLALRRVSASPALIAQLMGIEREICRKSCDYMVRRGIVSKHSISPRQVIYAAVFRARPPGDRRGKNPRSRNHRGAVAWASWLVMMQNRHGPTWRYVPRDPLSNWRPSCTIKP